LIKSEGLLVISRIRSHYLTRKGANLSNKLTALILPVTQTGVVATEYLLRPMLLKLLPKNMKAVYNNNVEKKFGMHDIDWTLRSIRFAAGYALRFVVFWLRPPRSDPLLREADGAVRKLKSTNSRLRLEWHTTIKIWDWLLNSRINQKSHFVGAI
jgi:hypothetical protein